jgi:Ca-activated chloride channel family protein
MKRNITAVLMILGLISTVLGRTPDQKVTINGHINCPFVSHNGGTAYLLLSITAPATESTRRQPMNLAVVLDRSGSMADQSKIEYAKKAVRTLIDQLQNDDIFSFVIYDDVVDVVRAARPVRDRQELLCILDEVYPRGATNLGGGLAEGLRQVERHRDKEYSNRVILLSDGLANRGITDPYELQRMVQRYRGKSISVTTMGVGLDYNENLMVRLSESGGGNYYFVESPQSLASIFRKELKSLSCVVAQNASIELRLGDGVRLRDVIGCEHRGDAKEVLIPIGDVYSNEHRELTVELEIPEGTGTLTVAKGVLKYDGKHGWFESWPSFATSIHYTKDFSEVDRNRDHETQAKADVAVSTRNVEKALRALDEGRHEDAARELKSAQAAIMASPAALSSGAGASLLNEQKGRLESYQQLLKDSTDDRKAKKSIQYENYQVQKKK